MEIVYGPVGEIDPAARRMTTDGGELTGDAIVVALGADLAPEAMPGQADVADAGRAPGRLEVESLKPQCGVS